MLLEAERVIRMRRAYVGGLLCISLIYALFVGAVPRSRTLLDFRMLSVDPAFELIDEALPSLSVHVIVKPPVLSARGNATVAVLVTNGSAGVDGATVELSSNRGGSFNLPSGLTDSTGHFNTSYLAPEVSNDVTVTITAYASKSGFVNASKIALLPVLVPKPIFVGGPLFNVLTLGVSLLVAAIVIFFIHRKRRKRRTKR